MGPSLFGPATLGTSYCAANVNSTGATGSTGAPTSNFANGLSIGFVP